MSRLLRLRGYPPCGGGRGRAQRGGAAAGGRSVGLPGTGHSLLCLHHLHHQFRVPSFPSLGRRRAAWLLPGISGSFPYSLVRSPSKKKVHQQHPYATAGHGALTCRLPTSGPPSSSLNVFLVLSLVTSLNKKNLTPLQGMALSPAGCPPAALHHRR